MDVFLWVCGGRSSVSADKAAAAFDLDSIIYTIPSFSVGCRSHTLLGPMVGMRGQWGSLTCDRDAGHTGPHAWYYHGSFQSYAGGALPTSGVVFEWPETSHGFGLRVVWHDEDEWEARSRK